MFPISAAALPSIPTRKALLVLDLQRDFVCADGALPVTEPDGFVSRALDLVKAFRDMGDVIWVRTEFERNRPLSPEEDRIIVSDLPAHRTSAMARRPSSRPKNNAALERDEEAFLTSSPGSGKPLCVRKGTLGAELAPSVKDAVVTGKDIVFTKTDYSAFAAGQQQLIQMLRGRFVTKVYFCGALTNVSVYATALDAGMHGYEMTLVEDCCGFRSEIRHMNAVKQLADLTGCDVLNSPAVLELLQPSAEGPRPKPSSSEGSKEVAAGDQSEDEAGHKYTGLSPVISQMSLGRQSNPPSTPSSSTLPQGSRQAPQPAAAARSNSKSDGRPGDQKSGVSSSAHKTTPLEAHGNDTVIEPDSSEDDGDSPERQNRIQALLASAASKRGARLRNSGAPPITGAKAEGSQPRTKAILRQRQRTASPDPKSATNPSQAALEEAVSNRRTSEAESSSSDQEAPSPAATATRSGTTPPAMAKPATTPTISEPLCAGDTSIITNVLPSALAEDAFERLLGEVSWAGMSHLGGEVPRRIAVQGAVDDEGNMPVYRHPADESPPLLPFSPTVLAIKAEVEKHLGHPLNHVLIQHYRTGNDYISEHSDKTLDIVRGSFIANVSLGAERTMLFRTKRPPKDSSKTAPEPEDGESPADKAKRQIQRAALPHNSLCRMGLETNMRWLHAIRQDKRADRDKSPAELSHGGARISLTFRQIGTFLNAAQTRIWGQGATSKAKKSARDVVNGQTPEAVRMLQAFGAENNSSDFDWDAMYGSGFDVLHMGTPKRFCASTGDAVANLRVGIALAELGLSCAKGSVEGDVRFEDNDPARTTVDGHDTVLRYLDAVYGVGRRYDQMLAGEVAKRFVLLQRGLDLLGKWKSALEKTEAEDNTATRKTGLSNLMKKDAVEWNRCAKAAVEGRLGKDNDDINEAIYIAGGKSPSPADYALWPVLHEMVRECGEGVLDGDHLKRYYREFGERGSVKKIIGLKTE